MLCMAAVRSAIDIVIPAASCGAFPRWSSASLQGMLAAVMTGRPLSTTLPRHLQALMVAGRPPYYVHQTYPPVWWGMLVVALLLVGAALGFVVAQAGTGRADFAVWAVGAFAAAFLIVLLRPAVWRVPVAMVADARGMHFLHGAGSVEIHSVAWRDVGAMRIERRAIDYGITRVVVVAIRSGSPFWTPATSSRYMRHLLQLADDDGYRRMPLPAVWAKPSRTLALLQQLKAHSDT